MLWLGSGLADWRIEVQLKKMGVFQFGVVS
jgi:hypothetical protein